MVLEEGDFRVSTKQWLPGNLDVSDCQKDSVDDA